MELLNFIFSNLWNNQQLHSRATFLVVLFSATFYYSLSLKNQSDHDKYDSMSADVKATRHQVMVLSAKLGALDIPELQKQKRDFIKLGMEGWAVAERQIQWWIESNHETYKDDTTEYMIALKKYGNHVLELLVLESANRYGSSLHGEFRKLHVETYPKFISRLERFISKHKGIPLVKGWKFDLSEYVFEPSKRDWVYFLNTVGQSGSKQTDETHIDFIAILERRNYTKRIEFSQRRGLTV